MGMLLLFAVYYPINYYIEPFEGIGPNWGDFLEQFPVWGLPYVLYTIVLLPLPLVFVALGTYNQKQRDHSESNDEKGNPMKAYMVNGLTSALAVSLFQTLLLFGFMISLLLIDIVPSTGRNAPDAAGGTLVLYVAYVLLVILQTVFTFIASMISAIWMVWAATGWKYSGTSHLQELESSFQNNGGLYSDTLWQTWRFRMMVWSSVSHRVGQMRVVALAAGWQLLFTLITRSAWMIFYYWAYEYYIFIGFPVVIGSFVIMLPFLMLCAVHVHEVMRWMTFQSERSIMLSD
jgi:hypothetical protein